MRLINRSTVRASSPLSTRTTLSCMTTSMTKLESSLQMVPTRLSLHRPLAVQMSKFACVVRSTLLRMPKTQLPARLLTSETPCCSSSSSERWQFEKPRSSCRVISSANRFARVPARHASTSQESVVVQRY